MPEGTHRVLSRDEGEMDIYGASRSARHAERLRIPRLTNMKQLLSNKAGAGTTSRGVTATEKTAIDICPARYRGAKKPCASSGWTGKQKLWHGDV